MVSLEEFPPDTFEAQVEANLGIGSAEPSNISNQESWLQQSHIDWNITTGDINAAFGDSAFIDQAFSAGDKFKNTLLSTKLWPQTVATARGHVEALLPPNTSENGIVLESYDELSELGIDIFSCIIV